MPIDFQDIHQQVRKLGEQAPLREEILRQTRDKSVRTLEEWSSKGELLRNRVEIASRENPGLRCAFPTSERLDFRSPLPTVASDSMVLAADGSQINPDRHAAVEFCVINVGAFEMCSDPSCPPRERIQSELLSPQQLYTSNGLISEEVVALRRDLKERHFLAELARQAKRPVITLTDGPLEVFRERESRETPEFRALFEEYLDVMADLSELGVTTAGYVDKPRGDLVVRLLELALLKENELDKAGRERSLIGLSDAALFRDRLEPGERSAVFGILSPSARFFQGSLALHFFYLNTGHSDAPWITRVEIPAWVAENHNLLDTLQAVLIHQCQILGARPYPYVLHRAHEVAVVSLDEKAQLEQMIIAEMYRRGVPVGDPSQKQSLKNLQHRTRYPR